MELLQKEVAELLGVNTWTVLNWKNGHTQPPIEAIPAIVRFLGYDPFPEPKTVAQHLAAKRREMGWPIKKAASVVGVDPGTWRKWERGRTILYRQHRVGIAQFLELPMNALNQEMVLRWNRAHKRVSH